jgi:hypothetical protein
MKPRTGLLILLLGGSAAFARQQEGDSLAARSATLRITSEPDSATVFVDGNRAGKTPLLLEGLSPGTHAIRLVAVDPGDWFSDVTRDTITLAGGDLRDLNYRLDRQCAVMTSPSGAEVLVGYSVAGTTPLLLPYALARSGQVRVRLAGTTAPPVVVDPGSRSTVIIPLALDAGGGAEVQDLRPGGSGRTGILIAAGGVVLSGGAAAYFKISADEKNAEYQRTGDPALRDQRNHRDLQAAVSLVLLQVSAAVLAGLLLAE